MKGIPALVVAFCLVSGTARSQTGARTDILSGRVTDLYGRPIAGALVGATAVGSGITRSNDTDGEGRYRIYFPGTPAQYLLQVKRMGFAPVTRTITRRTRDPEQLSVDIQLGGTPLALSIVEINGTAGASPSPASGKAAIDSTVPNPIAIILGMKDTLHLSAVQIVGLGDLSDTLQVRNSRIYRNIQALLASSRDAGDATQMAGSVAMMLEEASRNTAQAVSAAGKLLKPEQWVILPLDIRDLQDADRSGKQ